MSHDVFISHSTKDQEIADKVCSYLEGEGITYWIATRDARPGRDWSESIVNAISECKLVLLIFSSNSNDSPQIHREINIAADEGIDILPFRIEDIRPSAKLRYYLSMPHWLDALPSPNEGHFARLVNSVKTLLPDDSASVPTTPVPEITSSVPSSSEKSVGIPVPLPKKLISLRYRVNSSLAASIDSARQSGIIKFLLALFSIDRFALPDALEQTFVFKRKLFKIAGLAASFWLFFTMFYLVWTEGPANTLQKKIIFFSLLILIFYLPLLITGWILALLAKTHLITGFICGTCASACFLTVLVTMLATGWDSDYRVTYLSASITLVLLLIGILGRWSPLWIFCGSLSLLFLFVGVIRYYDYDRYGGYSSYIYAHLIFFGGVGLIWTIFAVRESRTVYEVKKKAPSH